MVVDAESEDTSPESPDVVEISAADTGTTLTTTVATGTLVVPLGGVGDAGAAVSYLAESMLVDGPLTRGGAATVITLGPVVAASLMGGAYAGGPALPTLAAPVFGVAAAATTEAPTPAARRQLTNARYKKSILPMRYDVALFAL